MLVFSYNSVRVAMWNKFGSYAAHAHNRYAHDRKARGCSPEWTERWGPSILINPIKSWIHTAAFVNYQEKNSTESLIFPKSFFYLSEEVSFIHLITPTFYSIFWLLIMAVFIIFFQDYNSPSLAFAHFLFSM